LDELAARFIINIPADEKENMVRVCFQVEQAHWFFIDFFVERQPGLRLAKCGMKEFTNHIFHHVPFLRRHEDRTEEILAEWQEYKQAVPTYGAIILNPALDKVLLVQGFFAKSSWGFPKGKVNQEEPSEECAAREVQEEVGYDISPLQNAEEYLEKRFGEQPVRLYLIPGVEESTKFETNTRCEIRDIRWFPLDALPASRTDPACKARLGVAPNSFFMVIPFIREIRAWVKLFSRAASLPPAAPGSRKKGRSQQRPEEAAGEQRQRSNSAEQAAAGREARDALVVEPSTREQGAREPSARELSAREPSAREQGAREQGIMKPVAKRPGERPRSKTSPGKGSPEKGSRKQLFQPVAEERAAPPGLLPPGFVPRAWAEFRLDHGELLAAALGGASDGVMHLGATRCQPASSC
jgi:mRNA-decapping enzyme subunit 2